MKKFAILACIMTVSVGAAMAQQTVSIPFFADSGATQAFVGIQNVGSTSVIVTANYLDTAGANAETGGTTTLAPGQSLSFRPATASSGEVQGNLSDASYSFGSIALTTDGGSVAGRYVQISGSGSFAHNVELN
jgi:hypothetical protein